MKSRKMVKVLKIGEFSPKEAAEILLEAQQKAAEENKERNNTTIITAVVSDVAEPLPDLNKIEVAEVTLPTFEEKKEMIHQEAEEVKQWSEGAGKMLMQVRRNLEVIRSEIKKIESDMIESDRSSEFSATARDLLVQWKQKEKEETAKEAQLLSVKNEAAKGHMEFSALLNEIRSTDPTNFAKVRDILNRLVNLKRYRLATSQDFREARERKKWPHGTRFFEEKVYINSIPEEEKTAGQRALEGETKKLVDAAKASKPGVIRSNGNADLTGYFAGKPDMYYFYSPERTDERGQKHSEGHTNVRLYDINKGEGKPFLKVEIPMATGDLGWMENHLGKRFIPLFWIQKGEIPEERKKAMKSEEIKYAKRIIFTLRALYRIWKNENEVNSEVELKRGIEYPKQNSLMDSEVLNSTVSATA